MRACMDVMYVYMYVCVCVCLLEKIKTLYAGMCVCCISTVRTRGNTKKKSKEEGREGKNVCGTVL